MLKIKLARFGKRKQPHYRIVINEARDKRDGQYVDIVGHYEPTAIPKTLQFDIPKVDAWIKKGAQPTDTVQALITRFKSGNPFPQRPAKPSRKAKAKAAAAAAAAAEEASAAPAQPAEPTAPSVETEAAPVVETTPEAA